MYSGQVGANSPVWFLLIASVLFFLVIAQIFYRVIKPFFLQLISLVMVSIGVYARMMKHAGKCHTECPKYALFLLFCYSPC